MKISTSPLCQLSGEERKTSYHFLAGCPANKLVCLQIPTLLPLELCMV